MTTIKFYCISLNSREDRRDKIKSEFSRLDIPIQWWIVERHPEGGNYGCFETHVNIWEKCNSDIVVVFEDDFEFNGTRKDFWKIINESVELSNKYDTIHLGNIPYIVDKRVSDNFYEGKFLIACCYLFRKSKIKPLIPIAKRYYGSQIDVCLSQISSQVGLLPCRISQDFTDSNNGWMKNIPIISLFPGFETNIRKEMTNDPYFLLKYPGIANELSIKFMVGLNCFQQVLPKILYNTSVEFTDRRVF
jgi:hypothetical protein